MSKNLGEKFEHMSTYYTINQISKLIFLKRLKYGNLHPDFSFFEEFGLKLKKPKIYIYFFIFVIKSFKNDLILFSKLY